MAVVPVQTWDDIIVEGPCDFGWRDATDSTGQQEALSLVEGHVSQQLGEGGVSVDRQGHCATVLSNLICGYAGETACIIRLRQRQEDAQKNSLYVCF